MSLSAKLIIVFGFIVSLTAVFYRDAFFAPFYREDVFFLATALPRDLFRAVPEIHYHPISVPLYYSLTRTFFGSNYFYYHLVEFVFYFVGLFFSWLLARKLTGSWKKATIALFLFALNISFFANFYWIAVSHFSIGAAFFFGSLYFFLLKGKLNGLIFLLLLLGSLGSNEAAIVLFPIFWLLAWYFKYFDRARLVTTSIFGCFYFVLRFFYFQLPTVTDYSVKVDFQALKTFEWYFLRGLNLPEGIRFSGDNVLLGFFAVLIFILTVAGVRYFRRPGCKIRLIIFGLLWIILGGLPFYLLPNHLSSYYFTFAFLGLGIVFAEILGRQKALAIAFCTAYFFLSIRGLDFLENTHWIILKNVGETQKFYSIPYIPSAGENIIK